MKQKTRNWIVLIVSVTVFFSLYAVMGINIGRSVRDNISNGVSSSAKAFLEEKAEEMDRNLDDVRNALPYVYGNEELLPILGIESVSLSSISVPPQAIDGEYLLLSRQEGGKTYVGKISIPSLFLDEGEGVGGTITLAEGGSWSSGTLSESAVIVERELTSLSGKISLYTEIAVPEESLSRGASVVMRGIKLGAVLFIVFILTLVAYVTHIEPFSEDRNKKKVDRIFRAVTDDFVFLVEVDMKSRTETVYYVSDLGKDIPRWSTDSRDFEKNISAYADVVVAAEDRENFRSQTRLDALMDHFRKNNNEYIIEYDVALNGRKLRFQGRFAYFPEENPPKMYIGIRDITATEKEKSDNHRKLMEALEAAEEANKGKSYFLFNMSHDIRTPLNAIIGYSDLAKRHLDDKELIGGYVDKIQSCGRQLVGLIGDVLDMAKIESGRTDLVERPCLCQDMMSDVFNSVMAAAEDKGLEFEATGNACHTTLICDKVKIQKILLNVLSNAVKYTPKGGKVSLDVNEKKREGENVSDFTFVVKDNGIGISESFLPFVFNSFSRERSATLSGISGTGLGMSITKRLVDAMGGEIGISSRQGEGTTVTIRLSLKTMETEEEEKSEKKKISLRGLKILLAEDNEINREIVTEMLREEEIMVDAAEDGEACIRKLLEHGPGYYSLILMDIQMPKMDGYEASRRIRKLADSALRTIPIVAITANAFEEDRDKAFKAGMNSHISKPIDMDLLLSTIEKCIIG